MKKMMRRILGSALALAMTAGLLSGCGSAYDPVKDVMGYKGSTVMFTVNGRDVTAEEYLFWLAQQADSANMYLSAMDSEDNQGSVWDMEVQEGVTAGDSIKEAAQQYAILYSVVAGKAQAEGYSYGREDKAAYQEELATAKEQLGGEEAYETYLKSMCISDSGFEKVSSVGVLYDHMLQGMFQEARTARPPGGPGEVCPGQRCPGGQAHPPADPGQPDRPGPVREEAAQKKAKAEELLAQLQAISDPAQLEEKFDELMNANSEDTGLAANPDGYAFTTGEMVQEFEDATRALEPGQISGLVESSYGYHIILRLEPTCAPVRTMWNEDQLNTLTGQWVEQAEVVTTETYDNLSVGDFYDKLTAYRETLNTTSEEAEQENGQVEQDTGGELPAQDGTSDGQTQEDAGAQDSGSKDAAPQEEGAADQGEKAPDDAGGESTPEE
ncbi:MAG: peptidylprolyl isomerase [Evtepia gabavorous]